MLLTYKIRVSGKGSSSTTKYLNHIVSDLNAAYGAVHMTLAYPMLFKPAA